MLPRIHVRAQTAAAAVISVAAFHWSCSSDAGLGEQCGESGHGTIACEAGLYCSRGGLNTALGVCRAKAANGEPCPEPDVESCAASLQCNSNFTPPVCTPPIARDGDCTRAACAAALICLRVETPATCQPPRTDAQSCAQNIDCRTGLTCVPATSPGTPSSCRQSSGEAALCDDIDDCIAPLKCNAGYSPAQCRPAGQAGAPCALVHDCRSLACDPNSGTCTDP